MEVRAIEASIVGFIVKPDDDVLPKIWVCSSLDCPIIAWMEGLQVVRVGYVTCLRCLRPMHLADATIH